MKFEGGDCYGVSNVQLGAKRVTDIAKIQLALADLKAGRVDDCLQKLAEAYRIAEYADQSRIKVLENSIKTALEALRVPKLELLEFIDELQDRQV